MLGSRGWAIIQYIAYITIIISHDFDLLYYRNGLIAICPPICLSLSIVPLPVVTISPGFVNVSYDSTVILTCEVQSLTTPTVSWTSNTEMTLPSPSLVSTNNIHTSTLTLEQVTLEYIGEYTCTAENEEGETSDMINVNVYGKKMMHLSTFMIILI